MSRNEWILVTMQFIAQSHGSMDNSLLRPGLINTYGNENSLLLHFLPFFFQDFRTISAAVSKFAFFHTEFH